MFKLLSVAALIGSAFAQSQGLNETLAANNQTSALAKLINSYPQLAAGLASARNVTLLAPSNQAIEALLNSSVGKQLASDPGLAQAVLQYHVLNGTIRGADFTNTSTFVPTMLNNASYANVTGGQRVNGLVVDGNVTIFSGLNANVSVIQADLNFTGGVIHIIDGVLTVPENASATAVAANLTSLAGALTAANLVGPVDSLRDVTIFAPANAAFQAIGSALANASESELTSVLEYHVVNGTVGYSSDLTNNMKLKTLGGGEVTVRIDNGTVFVNGAEVVLPDVLIANGVVHVIDNVLNPSNTTASPSASATMGAPAFSGASSVSSVPFTSGVPTPSSSVGSGPGGAGASSSSSRAEGAAMAMKTGAVGAAALFGAGAVMMNM